MAGTFEQLDGDTEVTFKFIADTVKVQAVINDAARILWDRKEPNGFELLSNQEKLDIVDEHIKKEILALAKNYVTSTGTNAARVQAEQDAADNHDLGA